MMILPRFKPSRLNARSGKWFTLVELGVTGERSRFVSSMKFRSPPKRFTLVELLVVIAIISILAGMLLPALRTAQEAGRSIVCVNNIKQVAMGSSFYASEYRDYLPGPATSRFNVSGTNWSFVDHIATYVQPGAPTAKKAPPYKCPSDEWFESKQHYSTSYGINVFSSFGLTWYNTSHWTYSPPVSLTKCRAPSRMFMQIEDYGHGLADLTHKTPPADMTTLGQAPAFRHNEAISVSFYDLSARTLMPGDVPCGLAYPGASREMIEHTYFHRGYLVKGHENSTIPGL